MDNQTPKRKDAQGRSIRVKPALPVERKKYLEKRYGKDYVAKFKQANKLGRIS